MKQREKFDKDVHSKSQIFLLRMIYYFFIFLILVHSLVMITYKDDKCLYSFEPNDSYIDRTSTVYRDYSDFKLNFTCQEKKYKKNLSKRDVNKIDNFEKTSFDFFMCNTLNFYGLGDKFPEYCWDDRIYKRGYMENIKALFSLTDS